MMHCPPHDGGGGVGAGVGMGVGKKGGGVGLALSVLVPLEGQHRICAAPGHMPVCTLAPWQACEPVSMHTPLVLTHEDSFGFWKPGIGQQRMCAAPAHRPVSTFMPLHVSMCVSMQVPVQAASLDCGATATTATTTRTKASLAARREKDILHAV